MNKFELQPNHKWGYTEQYLKDKMPSELFRLLPEYMKGKTGGFDDATGEAVCFYTDIERLINWYNEKMNEPKKGKK